MFRHEGQVEFPEYTGVNVNMMPIIMGDDGSVPNNLKQYLPMIHRCNFRSGTTVYLSVSESFVRQGETQRRPGIHTDGTATLGWGGGGWGGGYRPPPPPKKDEEKPSPPVSVPTKGIYLASTDGRCRIWDCVTLDVDNLGAAAEPDALSLEAEPGAMYWITDRTPHESLPALQDGHRQWFRLVADEIGAWYSRHSTPNPFGIAPNAPIIHENKFG